MCNVSCFIRTVSSGGCPAFNSQLGRADCLARNADCGACPLCEFTRTLPMLGKKLILRWWLAHLPDVELMAVLHNARALGGD